MDWSFYRLYWFELQICPHLFRFAITPNQPVLFSYVPDGGGQEQIILLPYEGHAATYDKLVDTIQELILKYRLLTLPPYQHELCFNREAMSQESLHLRFAYSNEKGWATMYPQKEVPQLLLDFVEEIRALGKEMLVPLPAQVVSGSEAKKLVDSNAEPAGKKPDTIVARVKITAAGKLTVNGRVTSLEELETLLKQLKEEDGKVWYSREESREEPSPETVDFIKQVLDLILKLKVKLRLVS